MAKRKNVLIIGCGWLGKITGRYLLDIGYSVTGSTRSRDGFPELEELGITPYQLVVDGTQSLSLPPADVVIISIAPGRGEQRDEYPIVIGNLAKELALSNAQVLMFSSTSVYGDATGLISEDDAIPNTDSNHSILAAEGELRRHIPDSVILRLGGLFGPDRHPVKYLAGRKGIRNGDAPVNLIHSSDVVASIEVLINKNLRTEVFNVVAPEHPSRKELYTAKAREFGLESPAFESGGKNGKVVDATKLKDTLRYEFRIPNPLSSDS